MRLATIILLFISVNLFATNYYVKNGGSDAKDGLSDANAWETIAKINAATFSPGDTIFFERGSSWDKRLTPPSSGTSGNQIVFSAYGTGVKPSFSFERTYTGWQQYSTNIFFVTYAQQTAFLCIFDDTIRGSQVATMDDLDSHREWREYMYGADEGIDDTLFIYTDTPSDTSTVFFANDVYGFYNVEVDYVKIEKLHFKYIGATAVYIATSTGVDVDSCDIEWSGLNGIMCVASDRAEITNSLFNKNGNDAIWQGYSGYIDFYNNVCTNNGDNLSQTGDKQTLGFFHSHHADVYNNTIVHTSSGSTIEASAYWGYPIVEDMNFYNNTISTISNNKAVFSIFAGDFDIYENSIKVIDQDETMPCFVGGEYDSTWTILRAYNNTIDGASSIVTFRNNDDTISTSHITLKNNIMSNVSSDYFNVHEFYRDKIVCDNNIYTEDGSGKWHIGTDAYDFSGWKAAISVDANSLIDDPEFTDTIDYELEETSPAIDAGIADAFYTDTLGLVYNGDAPDMGYWESSYVLAVPTVTTTQVSGDSSFYVSSGGNVTANGESVTAKGICWNTTGSPTTSDEITIDGTGADAYTSTPTNLYPGILYYIRAYATNSEGTAYGDTRQARPLFTTKPMKVSPSGSPIFRGGKVVTK